MKNGTRKGAARKQLTLVVFTRPCSRPARLYRSHPDGEPRRHVSRILRFLHLRNRRFACIRPPLFPGRIPISPAYGSLCQLCPRLYRPPSGCERLWPFRRSRRRSEEHTSELQSLMRISYAVFCLKKKTLNKTSISPH